VAFLLKKKNQSPLMHLMKTKKKKRAFAATDTLWKLVEEAAKTADMSINEWLTTAITTQLKDGVHGEGLGKDQVDSVKELAEAEALNTFSDSLTKAIEKTDYIFKVNRERLEKSLKLAKALNDKNSK
jgi:hypothetical protein